MDPSMQCVRGKTGEAQAGRIHTRQGGGFLVGEKETTCGEGKEEGGEKEELPPCFE